MFAWISLQAGGYNSQSRCNVARTLQRFVEACSPAIPLCCFPRCGRYSCTSTSRYILCVVLYIPLTMLVCSSIIYYMLKASSIYFDVADMKKLERLANKEGLKSSYLVRKAIKEFLQRHAEETKEK